MSNSKGTRLPESWKLPDDWRRWAIEELNLSPDRVTREAAFFRDYWHAKSGQNATKCNWQATWRNWCRKVVEYSPRVEVRPAPEAQEPETPFRSAKYATIAQEAIAAMRRRVR